MCSRGADVALQLLRPEDFGDGAGRLAAPQLELKQAVARRGVALGEEQVALVLRVDMVDSPAVAQHLDRLTQPGHLERRRRRRGANRSGEGGDTHGERDHLSHGRDASTALSNPTLPFSTEYRECDSASA
jgi:hypothetical protein